MSMAARFDDLSSAEAPARPRGGVGRALGLAVPAVTIIAIAGTEVHNARAGGGTPDPGWPAALAFGVVLLLVAGVWAVRAGRPTPTTQVAERVGSEPAAAAAIDEPELEAPELEEPELEAPEPEAPEPDEPVAEDDGSDEEPEEPVAEPVAEQPAAAGPARIEEMYAARSARASGLVDEQLVLLEDLERDEVDTERLQRLFDLDHLATRVRRHADSMGALTGADTPRESEMSLRDLLDAAVSAVRDYRRVLIEEPARRRVVAAASADIVLVVAELVDNALACSGDSPVVLTSANSRGGTVVEVIDAGPGLPPEIMAGANDAFEEGVDVTAGGTGLFVVGRLAARHGLRVQLRPHHEVGTVASVLLPEDVLVVPPPALSLLSGKLAARAAKPWGAPVRTGDEVTDEVSDERAEEPVEEPADVLEVEPQPPVALSVVRDPEPVADSEPDDRADEGADDSADDSEPRDLKTLLAPSHPRHRLGVPAQHEPAAPQPGRRVALGGSTPAIGDAPAVEGRRIRRP